MAANLRQPPPGDTLDSLRRNIRDHGTWPEAQAVKRLLHSLELTGGARHRAVAVAMKLVEGARARRDERPFLDAFLQQFGLSNQEGIALMCIAEALLRIPDDVTADRLIAEKLATGDWSAHAGQSESLFVNASTWGLMLTGGILDLDPGIKTDAAGWMRKLTRKAGEPVVRLAVRRAMKIIGGEFVVGRSIEEALARSAREAELGLCSFDMLGEGARTLMDAGRYLQSYRHAIDVIGASAAGRPVHEVSSISIKLSALEPRYSLLQHERVMQRLVPQVQELARQSARLGVQLTIDAEEADRLDLSLDIIEALAGDSVTREWPGLGLAVQAYGKRALDVIDWTAATAQRHGRRMTVRLVKGAYWDSEIKRAQERGLNGYPVYTRKLTTDVSYLACVGRLFHHAGLIYPQFATHNAHSIAAVLELAPSGANYEFQRLHGMGRLLYAEAARLVANFPRVRVYAPVGEHKDLLAYLVRRLLENGANTSFVNRFMDEQVPVAEIVRDPITELERLETYAHPRLPVPAALYSDRRNSRGIDLGDPPELDTLRAELSAHRQRKPGESPAAGPIINGQLLPGNSHPVSNPADRREQVGTTRDATADEIKMAFDASAAAQPAWNAGGGEVRASCLEKASDLLESDRAAFHELLVREAGKTISDAIAEVREAVDFCRYYALQARRQFAKPETLEGPTGEVNQLTLQGRGVFACISPWNFPLAIFAGQVTAALAAGNTVVAKPAEPTPLIAARFIRLLHAAGVAPQAVHLMPTPGRLFGEVALAHPALAGVAMTGSTATALTINRAMAARGGIIVPLIAETGGLNAMIVDSTALPEQVVDDVVSSAFMSAGQRCSALRLLFLQEEIADSVLEMIAGAMDELIIGDPADLQTDVGPVINAAARDGLAQHVERMRREARIVKACELRAAHANGTFFAPHLIELNNAGQLPREEFGPVLHVVRYRSGDIQQVLQAIRASHYGLTLGVQTRLESFWRRVFADTSIGNTYVNRNMIGAVVGVQPFGGNGLSGTGPKAGGPHYLARFANERTLTVNTTATGGNTALLNLGS
ncbi:MAG TPA: bifunctional proline dehydrogenase/L-glutamate gamma-semialdehyde dehydrogenase PutA [Steroidobacteraceae bacterium]|jgi:RHH-type proline utilization regulon transcriptional repressor/proline dehydrogenase/delta 1-pyrroline-5-carboxylate dehydrogenase|nr:bifunctional proline dehydrogenase/L-glutamate gamma-semialdehyde dehydrogenase PutA [Steroidobacteraceae bacterium]